MMRGSAEGGRPWAKEEAEPAAIMKAAEGESRDKMKRRSLSSTGENRSSLFFILISSKCCALRETLCKN